VSIRHRILKESGAPPSHVHSSSLVLDIGHQASLQPLELHGTYCRVLRRTLALLRWCRMQSFGILDRDADHGSAWSFSGASWPHSSNQRFRCTAHSELQRTADGSSHGANACGCGTTTRSELAAAEEGYRTAPQWAPPYANCTPSCIVTCHFVAWTAPPCFNTYAPPRPEAMLSAASSARNSMHVVRLM
jgi:hypothetical protein